MTDPKQSELEARAREWAERVDVLYMRDDRSLRLTELLASEVMPLMAAKEEAGARWRKDTPTASALAWREAHSEMSKACDSWREIAEALAKQSKWVANEARGWLGMEREKLVRLLSVTNVRVMEDALKAHGAALTAYEKAKGGEPRG